MWKAFNHSSRSFYEPDRFSGCTDYGLMALWVLQQAGYTPQWSAQTAADFKAMHETLCFVWFTGAWNQASGDVCCALERKSDCPSTHREYGWDWVMPSCPPSTQTRLI